GCIPLLMFFHDRKESRFQKISRQQLINLVTNDQVSEGVIKYNPQSSVLNEVEGWFPKKETNGTITQVHFRVKTKVNSELEALLLNKGFEVAEPNTFLL